MLSTEIGRLQTQLKEKNKNIDLKDSMILEKDETLKKTNYSSHDYELKINMLTAEN